MKSNFTKVAFAIAIVMLGGTNVYNAHTCETLSDVALANVEALADDEGINPGDPCYNKSTYDANKPLAVKCGSPCKFEHLDINFWETTSWCN